MYYNLEQNYSYSQTSKENEFWAYINKKCSFIEAIQTLEKIDWDFKDFNTQYLSHKFHSYPARFIPQIPLSFVKLFSKERETILDPFCGCGTTLVEALLNNRNSIGIDFNPLGVLISKVKTTMLSKEDIDFLEKNLSLLKYDLSIKSDTINDLYRSLPNNKSKRVFSHDAVKDMLHIKELIKNLKRNENRAVTDLWKVALSSTVLSIVNGKKPLSVKNFFINRVNSMILELNNMKRLIPQKPKILAIEGDSRNLLLKNDCVDLIVTSPPYVNALDYHRIHMYNMAWLEMDYQYFKKHEIGCHSHHIGNRFRLLSEYLGDMLRSLIEMNKVLKNNKLAILIVGNSTLEFEKIESYKFLSRLSNKVGFSHIKIIKRQIDISKKYLKKNIGKINEEYILILKKIKDSKVLSNNDCFISEKVEEEMSNFSKIIQKSISTSDKFSIPSKQRKIRNIEKIESAINTIHSDILIKN